MKQVFVKKKILYLLRKLAHLQPSAVDPDAKLH